MRNCLSNTIILYFCKYKIKQSPNAVNLYLAYFDLQVCTHIVQAIRKETLALREEWETRLCSGVQASDAPDTYCFEMLSMVLALSGSSVGRSYLAHQHSLLTDLLSLLHTGSARVQRQVCEDPNIALILCCVFCYLYYRVVSASSLE